MRKLLLCLLFTSPAFATEVYEPYQSVRSLGMGGAYSFSEHDAGVIFYNPAGLGKLSGNNFRVFNLDAGGPGPSELAGLKALGNVNGLASLNNFYGKNIYVGADVYSAVGTPYFGFAAFDNGATSIRLDNPIYPDLNVNLYNHYGFEMGTAVPLGPGLHFGVAAKRLVQMGGNFDFMAVDLAQASNNTLLSKVEGTGVGYGIDTGLVFTPPLVPLNPTISLSWQDVGQTAFQHSTGNTTPPSIHDNLSLGSSFSGSLPGLGIAAGLEYRHITDNSFPLPMKIHMGAEISILNMDFRMGFYQGYPTYGFGIDLLLLQLDVAEYTVERGAYAGQIPDQRIVLSLQMDFDFDLNFNLLDAGGSKRRLKQRR